MRSIAYLPLWLSGGATALIFNLPPATPGTHTFHQLAR